MNLNESLKAYKPNVEKYYDEWIRRLYSNLTRTFGFTFSQGPIVGSFASSRSIYNSSSAKLFKNVILPCCDSIPMHQDRIGRSNNDVYVINETKIAAIVSRMADDVILSWKSKIENKLGDLENSECKHLDGYRFRISGMKYGQNVVIDQDMILNVSKLGTLFNQFPARIYVNGKFLSEAKFKKLGVEA